jgi:hypothetical protein
MAAGARGMIVFDLVCAQGHRFEGWFASADAFDEQNDRKLVRCPMCDDQHVARLPSARVHVSKQSPAKTDAAVPAAAGMPAEMFRALREMVRNTEDVGERFPEEARKIHYEETPKRSIRGRATKEDADALKEEGIEFATLPPFLTQDPS